jgi:uncharacterized Tic20 family protein
MSTTGEPPILEPRMISTSSDDRLWAMLAHLSFLLTYVVGLSFLAPLIIWQVYKDKSPFVAEQAKEALNFQLATLVANAALGIGALVTCGISVFLIPVVLVGATVFCIMAGVAANRGERYRYPYTIRFLS